MADLVVAITEHDGKMTDQLLDQYRHQLEIGEGPIGLQHCKLRIMAARNALVTETAVEFENFGEARDQKAL